MIKTIILIIIGYIGFRVLKSWFLRHIRGNMPDSRQQSGEIEDIMIQDPVCRVYFPKRSGVHLNVDGKTIYFCSKECRQRYMTDNKLQ